MQTISTTTVHTTKEDSRALREQLRLFAFDTRVESEAVWTQSFDVNLSRRERLATLLEGELDFHGEKTGYASHDLHAFAAKFPPQLPRAFIRGLSFPGDLILDPMMGSGTTIVEAMLEDRRAIGFDLDPLALRLSRVKTMTIADEVLRKTGYQVLEEATALASELTDQKIFEQRMDRRFDTETRKFVEYWFLPVTQRELLALALAIEKIEDYQIRRFLELTFSATIVTKSGGVSRARDLAHSRPHLDMDKRPKNAIEQFALRLRKSLVSLAQLRSRNIAAAPLASDARSMPLADSSVDLIVTSPPYANAIDYMRAHKFSLVWLGHSVNELAKLRSEYIGSERAAGFKHVQLPPHSESIVGTLMEVDTKKALILRKYYAEMRSAFQEMHRVLKRDSSAIVVVGTSVMRGIDVLTHLCLAEIGTDVGFDVVGVAKRVLDRNKRMMPARWGRKTDSMIEQRMHEEYVIGMHKH